MIADLLQNIERYQGKCKNLDTAIAYLRSHDLAALPLGRSEVDGEAVFINVMETALRPAEGAAFEYHRSYADLQVNITGAERWGWASEAALQGDYDPKSDVGFSTGPEHAVGVLGGGRFVLFEPGEHHKPSCETDTCKTVRKAVVKILMV